MIQGKSTTQRRFWGSHRWGVCSDCCRLPPATDCAGEGGWGAVVGWEKVAPFQSWTPLKRSLTPRSPARRMSSARPSRSPRTSRSCCELLRRTNTTGQCRKEKNLLLFHVFFSVVNLNLFNCVHFLHSIFSHCTVPMIPPSPVPCPSPSRAGRASVKAHAASGTAWDASALWSPGLRKQPLPSIRSASDPLTPPPGTLASVPASQAQCSLPLPHTPSSVSCPSC